MCNRAKVGPGLSSRKAILTAMVLLCGVGISLTASAQQLVATTLASDSIEPGTAVSAPLPEAPQSHRFWDAENALLFTGVTAINSMDFVITKQNLQSGGKELNPITRIFAGSTAGLAVNFAGESAATMGIAYLFHRTGHHRLERMTSAVAMSISTQAVIYSGMHRR
jgi:hypothetical protein